MNRTIRILRIFIAFISFCLSGYIVIFLIKIIMINTFITADMAFYKCKYKNLILNLTVKFIVCFYLGHSFSECGFYKRTLRRYHHLRRGYSRFWSYPRIVRTSIIANVRDANAIRGAKVVG